MPATMFTLLVGSLCQHWRGWRETWGQPQDEAPIHLIVQRLLCGEYSLMGINSDIKICMPCSHFLGFLPLVFQSSSFLMEEVECFFCFFFFFLTNAKKYQFSSVAQSYPTLCDHMDHSMPGFPVHHQLLELTQTHVHQVSDAILPSHPLSSPSPTSIFPSIRVFTNELALCIRWPKYWSFSISPSNDYQGLTSFRTDWLISLKSKELSRVFSRTTIRNHQFFSV